MPIKPHNAYVHEVSRVAIKPKHVREEDQISYMSPWALSFLAIDYIQFGLLFNKPPPHLSTEIIIDNLKESLSSTLSYFPCLAGFLEVKESNGNAPTYSLSINCTDPPGAEFIYAVGKGITIAQVTSPNDNFQRPTLIESLYAFTSSVLSTDGQTKPLLVVKVTELVDGLFIGCSFNHSLADGTSVWHFYNSWSEISSKMMQSKSVDGGDEYLLSNPPIHDNWLMLNYGFPNINLPSKFYHQISSNGPPPPPSLRGVIMHFSAQTLAMLKAKANAECCNVDNNNSISTFQAFSAFLWRCITRARHLPIDQETSCILAVNDRPRLSPSLPQQQFGSYVQVLRAVTTAGELLDNNLGWSAWLVHEAVINHKNNVRPFVEDFIRDPSLPEIWGDNCVLLENSPRFGVYNNDFGFGKPVATRSGYGNKNDGTMVSYEGREGGGSIELDLVLSPEAMNALLSDAQLIDIVSSSSHI